MDKAAALAAIGQFKNALEDKGIRVARLVLYGSYAAGEQREGSDIDVVVVSDDFREKDYWQRIDILADAIYEVFQPIEAIATTEEDWRNSDSLMLQYARTGEVVYER